MWFRMAFSHMTTAEGGMLITSDGKIASSITDKSTSVCINSESLINLNC